MAIVPRIIRNLQALQVKAYDQGFLTTLTASQPYDAIQSTYLSIESDSYEILRFKVHGKDGKVPAIVVEWHTATEGGIIQIVETKTINNAGTSSEAIALIEAEILNYFPVWVI